ncbi:MAG: YbjP/YqhG family protein [Enterobacter sp.]|jgi:hypothetical protein|nr:YbjP/YqhG family protein [Enterobacter sp.]
MRNAFWILFLCSCSALAAQRDPVERAVEFNKWYVNQINNNVFPITDSKDIDKYVTASTMKKLRHTQDDNYGDKGEPFYAADLFLKAQDIGDDWPNNVIAIAGDTDPVCVNIYIAFGKNRDHTVIDCMVKEDGVWKVQSVAGMNISFKLAKDH